MALYFCLASGGESCHPLHKNNPLLPLETSPLRRREGKRSFPASRLNIGYFLRCGFSCLGKNREKRFADELNVSKHQRVFEGFGGIADFPTLPPGSGWRRKRRAFWCCRVSAFLDGDVAMAVTKCSPGRARAEAFISCVPEKGDPHVPPCGLHPRCPLTPRGICGPCRAGGADASGVDKLRVRLSGTCP